MIQKVGVCIKAIFGQGNVELLWIGSVHTKMYIVFTLQSTVQVQKKLWFFFPMQEKLFEFQLMDVFPALVNFEASFEASIEDDFHFPPPNQDLARISKVNVDIPDFDPFEVLSTYFPYAKWARFCGGGGIINPFNHPFPFDLTLKYDLSFQFTELKFVEITWFRDFSFEAFKLFFTSFPKLKDLILTLESMTGFDHDSFVKCLEENKPAYAQLKTLKLKLNFWPSSLTGESVCVLLKNSNLKELKELMEIRFSETELEVLKQIAEERDLKLTACYHYEVDEIGGWIDEEGWSDDEEGSDEEGWIDEVDWSDVEGGSDEEGWSDEEYESEEGHRGVLKG